MVYCSVCHAHMEKRRRFASLTPATLAGNACSTPAAAAMTSSPSQRPASPAMWMVWFLTSLLLCLELLTEPLLSPDLLLLLALQWPFLWDPLSGAGLRSCQTCLTMRFPRRLPSSFSSSAWRQAQSTDADEWDVLRALLLEVRNYSFVAPEA